MTDNPFDQELRIVDGDPGDVGFVTVEAKTPEGEKTTLGVKSGEIVVIDEFDD